MGFIILLIVITVICTGVGLLIWSFSSNFDILGGLFFGVGLVFSFVLLISVITAVWCNVGYKAFVYRNREVYNSLRYQLEYNLYDNDNDLGKKELYDQIQDWNSDLANGRAWTHDPWFGIFWTDAYDEFDYIELK